MKHTGLHQAQFSWHLARWLIFRLWPWEAASFKLIGCVPDTSVFFTCMNLCILPLFLKFIFLAFLQTFIQWRETNGAKIGGGQTQRASTQSSYMLTFLAYMSHAFAWMNLLYESCFRVKIRQIFLLYQIRW
jgi:hypothetical protein